ncbi:siroheme synthase [Altererythrobacter sp. GH1-8]|uniref:precorrin-2 dehydrogenase/sirohydrochlorin ferrochelatase family protein n=1 Tax=Altererythrobacter sp. GH1-8 TaxID=3349333 RepID=UPI00374CC28E
MHSLPLFHRLKGQPVLLLGDGEAAGAKRQLIERAGGIPVDDQQRAIDQGVRIAFVAYEDPKACEVAAINLRCAGLIVNVVDRPDLCDFTTPSLLDRDPVIIAVGTGGASAGLAKHLRLRLEKLLPQSLGKLADSLFGARDRLRSRFPDGRDRRRALDEALREGGALDPFAEGSADRVEAWLKGAQDKPSATETIALTSPDPDDLTLRQARWLGEADTLILAGDIPETILIRARADAVRIPASADVEAAGAPVGDMRSGLTVIIRAPER